MRVSIVGFGRAGKSCAEFLHKKGFEIFISEKENIEIPEWAEGETGCHTEKILNADFIVCSPGVPDLPVFEKAKKMGIPVVDEIEIGFKYCKNKIVAITGTNGKTTTCYLLKNILDKAGKKAVIAGNMGIPFTGIVNDLKGDEIVILEVSSFQLRRINKFRPYIGMILNISEDHLDKHKDFEEYVNAKFRIFENQKEEDFALLNENLKGYSYVQRIKSQIFWLSEVDYPVLWRCWRLDATFAVKAAEILSCNKDAIEEGIKTYKGVPHRLELVAEFEGRFFVNNSMCTNPEAFEKSLLSFDKKPIVICGGKDKGFGVDRVCSALKENAKFAILIGETKEKISEKLRKLSYKNFRIVEDMCEAVFEAFSVSSRGDYIVLNPGFASFDQFKDFADRGEKFKNCVQNLISVYSS